MAACAALGLSAAALPFHWRHGRKSWVLFPLAVLAAWCFPCGMDAAVGSTFALIIYGSALALTAANVWRGSWDED